MKPAIFLTVAALAGFGVSSALANPPGGGNGKHAGAKPSATTTGTTTSTDSTTTTTTTTARKGKRNKPPKTGAGCRPRVPVVLKGTLAADGAAAPFSLSVTVVRGNRASRAYKAATQPVSVDVTAATKVNRRRDHNPADLKSGDRVVVRAVVCKADLAKGATPALTAKRIVAHPAKAAKTSTTTTSTTTTETTTTTSG